MGVMVVEELPFNRLTHSEAERLAVLVGELGEAVKAIGDVLRHGYEAYSPFDECKVPNRKLLENELGDVFNAVRMMTEAEDVDIEAIRERVDYKKKTFGKWLHHQAMMEDF